MYEQGHTTASSSGSHAAAGPTSRAHCRPACTAELDACSGSISSKGMREFREDHLIRQKKGEPPKQPPLLPSDKNKMHTYGKPSSLKTEEEVRVSG